MTRTIHGPAAPRGASGPTPAERAVVLGGFALAALWTAASFAAGTGIEVAGALWLAAVAWAVVSSLALALRRGFRDRDWSAFRRHRLTDRRDERIDWVSKTGRYAYMRRRKDRHLR